MSEEDSDYFIDSGSEGDFDEDMMDGTQHNDGDSTPDEDVSDDGGFDVEITSKAFGKSKAAPYEVEFTSLSAEELRSQMKKDTEHISSVFEVEEGTALLLLRYMKWNKERLLEKFMDEPTKILVSAGVAVPQPSSPTSGTRRSTRRTPPSRSSSLLISGASAAPAPPTSDFMCNICCCDVTPAEASGLVCNHYFCNICWQMYLHTKIREEGECAVRCMQVDCSIQIPDSFVKRICVPEDSQRFDELVLKSYVGSIKELRFCPLPGCSETVSCPAASSKASLETIVPTVTCSEKHSFCFGCAQDGGHRPVVCSIAKLWLKKCQDDSETANWIKSNTKECPKCDSTIEKNGGCNHMTCKKCKNEFCWVCMGSWQEHGNSWYTCNRYDEKEGIDARDAQARSRASLERYLHYYNRWANHEQSARLSLELYAKTEKKMEEMQVTSDLTWIEVQFAKKAVDEVIKCRMTLKWTYAMAYYLTKGNQKELFEDNQRDLEKAVEDLSELLESPIEPEEIPVLRQKMTDKTVYVQKRNEIVLADTAQGFLDGRWSWNLASDVTSA